MSADNESRRSTPSVGSGRALRCEEARVLLMGYIDGELQPPETARLEDHLGVCVSCRREEVGFRRLGEVTEDMVNEEMPALDIDAAWETIYRRMERQVGWLLLSAGLIVVLGWVAWAFGSEFLLNADKPLVLRLGIAGTIAGAIVLLVSIGREVLTKYGSERYREVKR